MSAKAKDSQTFEQLKSDQMQRMLDVDAWKRWARQDGMPEPYLSNVCSWSQAQVLALAEQLHDEIIAAAPDPQQYPETKGMAEGLEARVDQAVSSQGMSRGSACLRTHKFHVKKFVVNFRPEELVGHTWRELRRSKGPMRYW